MTRFERITECYPYKHLFGSWYLVRNYTYSSRRFSLWFLLNSNKYKQDDSPSVPKGEFRLDDNNDIPLLEDTGDLSDEQIQKIYEEMDQIRKNYK